MMTTENAIAGDFESLFKELESERAVSESIRDKSKELDRCFRSLSSLLNALHSTPGDKTGTIVDQVPPVLVHARAVIAEVSELVPEHQYYRVSLSRKNCMRKKCLLILYSHTPSSTMTSHPNSKTWSLR